MKKINLLLFVFLAGLLACSDNDTETQIVTQIVEVPPAPPPTTAIALDISASQIDGALTNNGSAFPASIYEDGKIIYRGLGDGDSVTAGSTPFQSYDVLLVNDEYEVIYQVDTPSQQVPLNHAASLLTDRVISADETIDLDVASVEITPIFTLNGSNFPASQYDHGLFYLQPVGTNELIYIGDSNVVNQPFRVVPGDYHVIYDYQQGSTAPINQGARVMSDVTLDADQVLRINVLSGDFRATFTLNGGNFPVSQYDHADFYLKDRVTGQEFFLMKSYDDIASVIVIDGSYDVIYRLVQSSTVPVNAAKVVASNIVVAGGGAIAQDISTVTLGANVTLNGGAFQVNEYQDGVIELYDSDTDSYTELGNTHGEFTDLLVIPGTYTVTYSHESGDAVPQNTHGTVIAQQQIDVDEVIDIDVRGIVVSPDVTFNTATFPQSAYQSADLLLTGTQSTEDIRVANTANLDESVMVLPGTYDFYYRHKNGEEVPQNNHFTILSAQDLQADGELSANIQSVHIRMSATLNQMPFPMSQYQTGDIYALTEPGDDVFVLESHASGDAIMLIPGDYQFYYQHVNGDEVPQNIWVMVGEESIAALPSQ
jgi:hypothetical protein